MPINAACAPALTAIPGLVGLWKFDEPEAPPDQVIADSAGGTPPNHGTLRWGNGFVITDPPQAGQPALACDEGTSFLFQGFNGRVEVPDSPSLAITGPYTLFAWVHLTAFGGDCGLLDKGTLGGGGWTAGGYGLWTETATSGSNAGDGGHPVLAVAGGGGTFDRLVSTTYLDSETTYFLAGVHTGTQLRLYVDGVPVSWKTTSVLPTSGGAPLYLAYSAWQGAYAFAGLDNMGVVNGALSDAEVLALYNACRCATGRQRASTQLFGA